jgi:hypothetical protein
MRSVPLGYKELVAALEANVFPAERSWIDFKRRLYPDDPADRPGRARASLELAKDMASMAPMGGYLVYGVKEDKDRHLFEVDEMPLPVGLHETVDAVAQDKITPALTVVPTLVHEPEATHGFLVVEIPPSPDSPHMADSIYWGRSETGKVRLTDAEVERLILGRSRLLGRLDGAMAATVDSDPITTTRQGCHFYLTAVPAIGWPEMAAGFTRDHHARMKLLHRLSDLAMTFERAERDQRPTTVAFGNMIHDHRSQRTRTAWLATWSGTATDGLGRMIGVDDDGTIRYINIGAYSSFSINQNQFLVNDVQLLHETRDMIRLVSALADDIGYVGSWRIGVHLDRLRGHMTHLVDPYRGGTMIGASAWNGADYWERTHAAAIELREKPEVVTGRLMRLLMRGLGTEPFLSQPPFNLD